MATKKTRKAPKRVKSLRPRTLDAKQARSVKGGDKPKGGKVALQDFSFTHVVDKASP